MNVSRRTAVPASVAVIILWSAVLLFSSPSDDKRVSVYSVVANYGLPVTQQNGKDYVGLLEALDPLGTVKASVTGGRWKLHYDRVEAEFTPGSSRAHVRHHDVELHGAFLLENGRGLVPLEDLGQLLSEILGGPVTFHEASGRILIGSVAVHFTAQISEQNPPTLTMNFTAPVNPMIATEPGKLHMIFSREPVVAPSAPALTFGNQIIPSASYEEKNGAAEITVNGNAPLFAKFSDGNRRITISASLMPAQPNVVSHQSPPSATAAPAGTEAPANAPPERLFAIIDAGHGGVDNGELISNQLAEKDITLAFARDLRLQLQEHSLKAVLLRDGDSTISLDQRAVQVNTLRPAVYICLHASSEGSGVRIYTSALPADGNDKGPFLDWDTAQQSLLPLSGETAADLALEMRKSQIASRVLIAPLRPLNNIATAAVAVEVEPPAEGASGFMSASYRQLIDGAIARGLMNARARLEAAR